MIQNNVELSILLKGKMLLVHGSIKPCDLSVTNLDDKDEEFIDLFSFFPVKILLFQFKVQRHQISHS